MTGTDGKAVENGRNKRITTCINYTSARRSAREVYYTPYAGPVHIRRLITAGSNLGWPTTRVIHRAPLLKRITPNVYRK